MKRKKILVFGLMILIVAATVAFFCFFRHRKESDILWASNWQGARWFNENGAFEVDGDLLYYYNPQSLKRVVACGKAGCRHEGKGCPAYGGDMCGITFTSTGLMYFSSISDRMDMYGLYQIDSDGTNLRQLHRFRDVDMVGVGGGIEYDGNQIWFSYNRIVDDDGKDLVEPESGIIGYNLENGKEKRVFKERKVASHISALARCGSEVYFIYRYSDMTRAEALEHAEDQDYADGKEHFVLAAVSEDGGDYRIISEEIFSATCLSVAEDAVYFCREDGVYACDTKTKEVSRVKKGSFEMIPAYRDGEQELMLRDMDSAAEQKSYWHWNEGAFHKISGGGEVCLSVNGDYAWFMDEEGTWMVADAEDFLSGKKLTCRSF